MSSIHTKEKKLALLNENRKALLKEFYKSIEEYKPFEEVNFIFCQLRDIDKQITILTESSDEFPK